MTKQLYPTQRQKAIFECANSKVEPYQELTSASIMYFRFAYRTTLTVFAIMLVASGWELLARLLFAEHETANLQILTMGKAIFALGLAFTMYMLNNQILLILGHGYRDKTAQLHVDRLTTKEDCVANLKIMGSMYSFTIIMALIGLWLIWGGIGTPFYKGLIGEQIEAMQAVIFVIGQQITHPFYDGYPDKATMLKPFYFVATACFFIAIVCATLGFINTKTTSVKITRL